MGEQVTTPTDRVSTAVDGVDVLGALSPSRAAGFLRCPLLHRFRTIDRLPEPDSADATRGTVVHRVLDAVFDLPPDERTPEQALAMLGPAWSMILEQEPELDKLFPGPEELTTWLASCAVVLERWFSMEDPRRLEPAEREVYVEALLDSKLLLRGFVDRVDVSADGAMRVVDYKTGRSPAVGFESSALFQMRFYALVLWRTRGRVPDVLRLVYLGNGEIVSYVPDEADLLATERKVEAIWAAIELARTTGDWQPSPGPLCAWCPHQDLCPTFGNTPPPLPEVLPLPEPPAT